MNRKMIEIEAKYQVLDVNFLKAWLQKFAAKASAKRTIDTYYVPAHRNFMAVEHPFEWLRLRKEDDGQTINYKHWYPEDSAKNTHCDEFETAIGSAEVAEKIFAALDIKPIIVVDKYRENYRLEDMEFSLDQVKDLGWFVEIEYKGETLGIDEANEEFKKYEKLLETALGERNYRGYPYLVLERQGGLSALK